MYIYIYFTFTFTQKCLKFFSQINHWVLFILLQCVESRSSSYYEHKDNFCTPSNNLRKISCSIGFLFEFGWIFEKCKIVTPTRQIFQALKLKCWNNGLYRFRMKEKKNVTILTEVEILYGRKIICPNVLKNKPNKS